MTARLAICCVTALLGYAVPLSAQVGATPPPGPRGVEATPRTTRCELTGIDVSPTNGLPMPSSPITADGQKDNPDTRNTLGQGDQSNLDTAEKSVSDPSRKPTVEMLDGNFKLKLYGAVTADFFFNSARPVAPGTPYYLTPGPNPGVRQNTFDASARQTFLAALITGPQLGDFETGAQLKANFYSSAIIQDQYGLLPLQAFGYLKNDDWRFAAGLQQDIFNPLNPTLLPFTVLIASGNTGLLCSQGRIERFFHPSDDSQLTLTVGISEPLPTLVDNEFRISEDNGWPNVEGRMALALGPLVGEGADATRPFELGISGVVGQIRTTIANQAQVVADVWGLGSDLRWVITDRFGIQAEGYVGQTLGTYGGGILQDINSITFTGVRSTGGWCEIYYYLCPNKLHTHVGYGVDDPLNRDLAPGQRLRNQTYYANLIWNVTQAFQLGGELNYRNTSWVELRDNDGVSFQFQAEWKF